jgi:hypothetical protein
MGRSFGHVPSKTETWGLCSRTSIVVEDVIADLKVMKNVGDIPNRYTSNVFLNQQARVAHQGWYGGFAIPRGPVAEAHTAVQDAGAYGGYLDRPMADPETGPWRNADD